MTLGELQLVAVVGAGGLVALIDAAILWWRGFSLRRAQRKAERVTVPAATVVTRGRR